MSEETVHIKIKLNYPVVLGLVLVLHVLLLLTRAVDNWDKYLPRFTSRKKDSLIIRDIRTVGSRNSKIHNSTFIDQKPKQASAPRQQAPKPQDGKTTPETKKALSLSDLAAGKPNASEMKPVAESKPKMQRPGSRPELPGEQKKALNAISLKGGQIRQFAEATNAAQISGDPRAASLNNTDVLVNLEVPEGVNPDELNKYELMFYGFQRRTAIGYINSFYKNLDKFQRENPHLQFPMTDTKQVMTGRLTYDEKGNLKQIKMIRWTNVERLQDFFVDVLKDMDSLHNPPQALWDKSGEFSIFFSLVVNG